MPTEARKNLAAAQLELVRSLVSKSGVPAGFDLSRIQATADTLMLKRARAVARVWPQLARSLGPAFDDRFALYAQAHPITREGGGFADGRAFVFALEREGALADEAVMEAVAFDLRYSLRRESAVARRGFGIRFARLKQSHRFLIAIRLPVLGERWINLPFKIL